MGTLRDDINWMFYKRCEGARRNGFAFVCSDECEPQMIKWSLEDAFAYNAPYIDVFDKEGKYLMTFEQINGEWDG